MNVAPVKKRISSETLGFCFALCSALCYTVSLSSMRGITNFPQVSPDWSLAVKELTCVAIVLPFIITQYIRGKYKFPKLSAFLGLVLAGISCEVVGSRPHLFAYACIGLALASPLIQAAQLIFSSIVGSVWLHERVTKSKLVALGLLIVAVWLLSQTGDGSGSIAGSEMKLGIGIFWTLCTAIGYCGQLSIMRRVMRLETPEEAESRKSEGKESTKAPCPTSLAMVTITGVGVIACGLIFTFQHGVHAWVEPPAECWRYVLTAGIANTSGFFCQIESIKRLYVLKQALIATAQTATLCLFGVFLFGEPFDLNAALGVGLVMAGVIVSALSK